MQTDGNGNGDNVVGLNFSGGGGPERHLWINGQVKFVLFSVRVGWNVRVLESYPRLQLYDVCYGNSKTVITTTT